ncbi:MAG TPA: ethanolamine ammonia-lyase subunit EutB, partial [Myxococcota bacterium]|nr:ethanolamine ammonia-lyase subunit EutB [Myxococcota bacterium]
PNSPTDHPEDIRWQIFNGFSFAVGDVLLGTNPVDGRAETVGRIERELRDIIETFGLQDILPWCVLAHIDTQANLLETSPGDVALMFQSLAGNDDANGTFGIDVAKMLAHNARERGRWGFYYETGQGADFTNGAHHGTDMVVHEARKYGFVRALKRVLAQHSPQAWTLVNDVAGFIGPEVFQCREQLVRCCLEDLVMGKLHGLCIGHDICATLHMSVSLDDLAWCQDQVAPANPAYLMALPTRNDPMLSYLTTSFQDHVALRQRHGFRIDDAMAAFFHRIGVLDAEGRHTAHAGDPFWVYYQYRRAKGDRRAKDSILREGRERARAVASRGVPLAIGHGATVADMAPALAAEVEALYADARTCLRADLTDGFLASLPATLVLDTQAPTREVYILRPPQGEALTEAAAQKLRALRDTRRQSPVDVQVLISDGLNAAAIMDTGHLAPLLMALPPLLAARGLRVAPELVVLRQGRVRAGYAAG